MKKKEKGFTLIELMIVVAIVAILAAIAYPSYQDSVRKSRRTDAQGALMGFATAMERYYTNNNTYVGAVAGVVYSAKSPIDGTTKYYDLTIEASTTTTYTLRATPTGAQAGDGYLEILSTGLKRWQTGGGVNDCWAKTC